MIRARLCLLGVFVGLLSLWVSPALAQLALPGFNDGAVELPVTEDPADRLVRDLSAAELAAEGRLERLQERSRFFLERVDSRRSELDRREKALRTRRTELGRSGSERRQTITLILEQMRTLNLRLTRIEEVWTAQIDELAETATSSARLLNRIEGTRRGDGRSETSPLVEAKIEAVVAREREVQDHLGALRSLAASVDRDVAEHSALLDEARRRLAERDRRLVDEIGLGAILGDDDDSADGEPVAPPVELSDAEQELLQLEEEELRLAVRLLERSCELDRLERARLEYQSAREGLEVPVLEWEREVLEARRAALAAREEGGLLAQEEGLISQAVVDIAVAHTRKLLLDPQGSLEDMLARTRRAPGDRVGGAFFMWVGLLGILALLGTLRLHKVLHTATPSSPREALAFRALRAALPTLPVAVVCFPFSALGGVPDVLVPVYRFCTFGLPTLAAVVAVGTGLFPTTEGPGAQVARYTRRVVRIGAGLAVLILLIEDVLPLFGYPTGVRRLVRGFALAWVLFGWLLFMVRKNELLAVLDSGSEEGGESVLRTAISRIYPLIALGPVGIYLLYVAGYANLARFLIQGGLVTLAVLLLAPWAHARLREVSARAVGHPGGGGWLALSSDGSKAAYQTVAPLVTLGVGGVAAILVAAGWNSGQKLGSLGGLVTQPLFDVGGSHVSIGSILLFGITLVATLLVSRQATRLMNTHIYPLYDVDRGMRATLDTMSRYLVLVIGVVVGLDVVGVGIGFLTVFAGIVGIGIGFGSQTLAANFISGLILLFARPVAVDDVIEVNGITGRVIRISAYATVVRTLDNLTVVIPNSDLVGGSVVNWSVDDPKVRLNVVVGVAYGSDVALVRRLLLQAAAEDPHVLRQPAPEVRFDDFGDSALIFTLLPWTDEPDRRFRLGSSLRTRIDALFRAHGVEIPFPQTDIHLRSGDGRLLVKLEPEGGGPA